MSASGVAGGRVSIATQHGEARAGDLQAEILICCYVEQMPELSLTRANGNLGIELTIDRANTGCASDHVAGDLAGQCLMEVAQYHEVLLRIGKLWKGIFDDAVNIDTTGQPGCHLPL